MIDPAIHAECLEFICATIAAADRTIAHQIAAVLKEVCQNKYTDRAKIWADLTETEQQQFQTLLAPPPIARDFARRIEEAIGYQCGAVAAAIHGDLSDAIPARKLASADVVAIVGEMQVGEFQ